MDDVTLKIWSYVNISSYRVKAVKALKDEVKTPTQIAADAGIRTNHMSKVLKELKESGVAECINEEARKGRLYRLTDVLKQIIERIPEDYSIEVITGKNTHCLSDQIQIDIIGKKLIFNKY